MGSDEKISAPLPRILLAEDNDVNQLVASSILEQKGYQVDIAGDGAQALAMATRTRYECVLMDYHMPIMNGLEAARRIRAMERENKLPPVPIIALTASAMEGDKTKCVEAGMNHFLFKPFVAGDLHAIVELAIRKESGAMIDGIRIESDAIADLLRLEAVPGTVKTIVGIFFEDTREALAKLTGGGALSSDEVTLLVHSLKSTFGQLGALGLARIAQDAELAARGGDVATALASAKLIAEEYPRFEKALRAHPQLENLLG